MKTEALGRGYICSELGLQLRNNGLGTSERQCKKDLVSHVRLPCLSITCAIHMKHQLSKL